MTETKRLREIMRGDRLLFRRLFLSLLSLFFLIPLAYADNFAHTINPLNYFDSAVNHTGNVTWYSTDGSAANMTLMVPDTWTLSAVSPTSGTSFCTIQSNATQLNCTVSSNASIYYYFHNPNAGTASELSQNIVNFEFSNKTTVETPNRTLVKINRTKIMDTLVELGRGRGNYIFSTRYGGAKESSGNTYFPGDTKTQLYFLHRIYNIGQYVDAGAVKAGDVRLDCYYPNNTLVVYHMASQTSLGNPNWTINYSFNEIEPSFWRMPYSGIEVQTTDYNSSRGDSINTACKGMNYSLPGYGNVSFSVTGAFDSVNLSAGNTTPVLVTVNNPTASLVYTGQTEAAITYEIKNGGNYDLSDLVFEVTSPQYSKWIASRAEIFGDASERYTTTISKLEKGKTVNVTLYAKFDIPSSVGNGTSLDSGNWTSKFIPPWEKTAYNPMELEQSVSLGSSYFKTDNSRTVSVEDVGRTGQLRTISSSLNQTRQYLDEVVFLVTDSIGAAPSGENQGSAASPINEKGAGAGGSNIAFYLTQKIANNAWLLVLAISILVAALLLRRRNSSPYGYYRTYRPSIIQPSRIV